MASSHKQIDNEIIDTEEFQIVKALDFLSEPEGNLMYTMSVAINDGNQIAGLIIETGSYRKVIASSQLSMGEVVMSHVGGLESVFIDGSQADFDEEGGMVRLRYIFNALTMQYKVFDFYFSKDSDDTWQLYTKKGVKLTSLAFRSQYFMGQIIGISKIDFNVL